jgi:Asp-tRNA(Asn)/Glu-tRNA(Gln) amidotransferase A subunit family amidase
MKKLSFLICCALLWACQPSPSVSESSLIEAMGKLLDLEYTQAEIDSLQQGLSNYQKTYVTLHEQSIPNHVPPAFQFNPLPLGFFPHRNQEKIQWNLPENVEVPSHPADLAFLSVAEQAALLRDRKITSLQLTKVYLDRLKTYGDTLQCVVSLLETTALLRAQKADEEIASGKWRGPLHGIPYGVKDLLAVENTRTTWGATPFKDQEIAQTASVVKLLDDAGAILVAKLTLGALAMGDIWYGGVTKNPWNLTQGSSGSSAGSASATSAGLVSFAIGSETWGSIVSPATRCGTTGLRPTYGRVSRTGAMALSWSMDKLGPLCRSAKDAALVFEVIRAADPSDPTLIEAAFNFREVKELSQMKIGYFKNLFEADYPSRATDSTSLVVLQGLGAQLEEVSLPSNVPANALSIILMAEAAAAFDELTRSGQDDLLVNQRRNAWPNLFRTARFIPAVEYIQASRLRFQLIQEMHGLMKNYDVVVTPSFGGNQLLITNLTGHPCVVVPNGFNENGSPVSISFLANLFDEASALAVANAFQQATDHHRTHPPYFLK